MTPPDHDPSAFDRLRRLGGEAFLGKMVDLYFEGVSQRMAAGRAGLASGNLDEVQRAVHSLKSSAGNVGARHVAELAEEIEQLAGEQRDVADLWRALEAAVLRSFKYLEVWKTGGAS
jgi:HPt (histidine-containing phosphotransfer) domain-containing protein